MLWDSTDAMGDDVRFKSHGLAPKSAAQFPSRKSLCAQGSLSDPSEGSGWDHPA